MRRRRNGMALVCALALTLVACGSQDGKKAASEHNAVGGAMGAEESSAGALAGGGVDESDASAPWPSRLDLLLVVDNSISMQPKQEVLAQVLPELIAGLVSPPCVDERGAVVARPSAADVACRAGTQRAYAPFEDLHVGVVTSSLGDAGAKRGCSAPGGQSEGPGFDMAHLVGSLPRSTAADDFVAWASGSSSASAGRDAARDVLAAGGDGCGFEATLEAWYRFLIEPKPYLRLERRACDGAEAASGDDCVGPERDGDGQPLVDTELLRQRAEFLRPDSLLMIVVISDENDCSLNPAAQAWRLAEYQNDAGALVRAFRASAQCDAEPNDPCCQSCGEPPAANCPREQSARGEVALGCETERYEGESGADGRSEDSPSLRCFEQKRRFGFDVLFPVARYINALSQASLCTSAADLSLAASDCDPATVVDNPLFAGEAARAPGQVVLAGLLGVPWQDVARQDGDTLTEPMRLRSTWPRADFTGGDSVQWSWLLGPERDPFLVESVEPRLGSDRVNPVTGAGPMPPESEPNASAINGHEWNNTRADTLQYSCISPDDRLCPTREEVDEARIAGNPLPDCDCSYYQAETERNPLCQGPDGSYSEQQYAVGAFPPLRQLEVLRGVVSSAVVGSICARQLDDESAEDYGHRPLVTALFEHVAAMAEAR